MVVVALMALGGCELPSWVGGGPKPIKRAPGERFDVIVTQPTLKPDEEALEMPIEIPEQLGTEEWRSRNDAMLSKHIGLTGIQNEDSATIGDGNDFSSTNGPEPIVVGGYVFAMDAAGIVSAHNTSDLSQVLWTSEAGVVEDVDDQLGGGLVYADDVVFASTGYGMLLALDVRSGKTIWKTSVGTPVRGAPAYGSGIVAVITADNQALAFDAKTGTPRWEHRGIRESAGYFSTTSPVISEGILVAAYSSGELFALRAETGNVLWSDTLTSDIRTRASAVFSGIDADPIVQDGVVVVTSASGVMQASALLNGRPLWQQRVGSHQMPWSAGNALFVISATHDVAAILKRDGLVRWAGSLAQNDGFKDTTPAMYGPILAGNALMVLDATGLLLTFKPEDGTHLGDYELAADPVTAPIIAGGAMYYVTRDARLHKYY